MPSLHSLLTAHPLPKKPYNAIKFARLDGNGTPLYIVGKDRKELGAAAALKTAFERWGGHCFHCKSELNICLRSRPTSPSAFCTSLVDAKAVGSDHPDERLVFDNKDFFGEDFFIAAQY